LPAAKFVLSAFAAALLLAACPVPAAKAGPAEIDAAAYMTLERFFYRVPPSRALAKKAAGVLVFPSVVKAGFGLAGEYGEGALLIHGRKAGYYSLVSGSFGFQLGVQSRSVVIMFMEREGLDAFRRRNGWKVGVEGSVTMIEAGTQGAIDTDNMHSPIIGFVSDHMGLMAGVSLEGSKISRIYQ
jgi:lipid-binding SYLF domain-containing protein